MRAGAAILAAWLAGAGAVAAQEAAPQPQAQIELPPPVLTIDAPRLLAETAFGKALAAEVDAAARRLAEENRRIEADLLEEERALTERRSAMSPDEFRPLADAFDAKVQELRAAQDEKERALSLLQEEGRQRFLQEVEPILAEIMREEGALVLFDRRDVVLSADAIDITDAAIARVDAAGLRVEPSPEPQPAPAP